MNLFFLILAIIVLLYLIQAIVTYKNQKKIITFLLILCALFDVFLFWCAFFSEE